jgi:hypothetical protein
MGYDDGVFMYDPSLQPVVLEKLAKWGRLTESDLTAMLSPEQRVRVREDLLKDLDWEGLLTIEVVGDEPVFTITERGRQWLEERRTESPRSQVPGRTTSDPYVGPGTWDLGSGKR